MNAYACFPDLPSPVQRYIRTLEADKEALEAEGSARSARGGGGAAHCRVKRAGALSRRAIPACATEALCVAEREVPRARVQRSRARSQSGSGHRREDGSPAGHGSAARGAALTRTPAGPARAARRTAAPAD